MTPEAREPGDDAFTAHLVAVDEALAAGLEASQLGVPKDTDPALQTRLAKGLACLAALQDLRPRSQPSSLREKAVNDTSEILGLRLGHHASSDLHGLRLSTGTLEEKPGAVGPNPDHLVPGMRLGRFEVKRELGRGGFGVMFLAWDPNRRRPVALKVPHATALMSPDLRNRFEQEAQAAASLVHPNIAPVYEAGTIGPISYIAYRFCPGINLADWLRRQTTSVPVDAAVDLVATLAEAVAHAHERLVWHRDLKPANVMLTPRALLALPESRSAGSSSEPPTSQAEPTALSACSPILIDFGLARVVANPTLTRTGAILGTPCYMAPEQAGGRKGAFGPAIDIHGLGVILYELLVGRPPYRGETDIDTLLQVQSQEPVPPRTLRPGVPRDVETICLHCLHKDPARRYTSASELAADLRRYQQRQPIHARPVSTFERLWRRCRQRPVVAGLIVALMGSLALGLAGVLWQSEQTRLERNTAVDERQQAERLHDRAHEALRRLTALSEELLKDPVTELKGQELLREAMSYYDGLLAEPRQRASVRQELAQIAFRLARIQSANGEDAAADRSYQQAIRLFEENLAQQPESLQVRDDLARCWLRYGHLLRRMSQMETARDAYHRSIEQCQAGLARMPSNVHFILLEAIDWLNLAVIRSGEGDAQGALEFTERAIAMQRTVLANLPELKTAQTDLALSLDYLGQLSANARRMDVAEKAFREALELRAQLAEPVDCGAFEISEHAAALRHYGQFLAAQRDWETAENLVRQAEATYQTAVLRAQNFPESRHELHNTHTLLGEILIQRGQVLEALATFRLALATRAVLHRTFPLYPHGSLSLASARIRLADTLQRLGEYTEAAAELESASAEMAISNTNLPEYLRTRRSLLRVAEELARALEHGPEPERAVEARMRLAEFDLLLP